MQTQESGSEKKEISEEGQETLDSLRNPILADVEAAGMPRDQWVKEIVKLSRTAKKRKPQKLTGEIETDSLKRGVTQIAKTDKESLVLVPTADYEVRLSALTLIGKTTGWVDPDTMNLKTKEPVIIELREEGSEDVHVTPEA